MKLFVVVSRVLCHFAPFHLFCPFHCDSYPDCVIFCNQNFEFVDDELNSITSTTTLSTMRIVRPSWVQSTEKGISLSIFSIDFHPSGTKFATGGQGNDCGRVSVWNVEPLKSKSNESNENIPKCLCQIDSHLQCVNAVRWSNSGDYLASAGDDQLIMIWSLSGRYAGPGPTEQYRAVSTLRTHSGDILDLCWSPDDQYLASCSVDNMVVIWNAQKWPEVTTILKGHTGLVKGVSWDPIGKYLASQSDDKTLRVWRVSDWSEEVVIAEPFELCGGTTHVLRPSWSPDGQYLVSAQALNNAGSVAKIISRQDWSFSQDYVGHRKAIPCVCFNNNIFKLFANKKKGKNGENSTQNVSSKFKPHSLIAIGSRDRSITIWSTSETRPRIYLENVFENSVLDISWSKTGYEMIACSMDGSIVYFEFTEKELGQIYNEQERSQYLQQLYGSNFGSKAVIFTKLPEDIEFLEEMDKKCSDKVTEPLANGSQNITTPDGDHSQHSFKSTAAMNNNSNSFKANNNEANNLVTLSKLAKGPTDKQIEIKQQDGRRRIIPLYIPPVTDATSSVAPSALPPQPTTFSSSRESKSTIMVEHIDESNSCSSYPSVIAKKKKNESLLLPTTINDKDLPRPSCDRKIEPITISDSSSSSSSPSSSSSEEEIVINRSKNNSVKRTSIDLGVPTQKRKPGRPPLSSKQSTSVVEPPPVPLKVQVKPSVVSNHADKVDHRPNKLQPPPSRHKPMKSILDNSDKPLLFITFPPLKFPKQNQQNIKLFTTSNHVVHTASLEYPLSSSSLCKVTLIVNNEPICHIMLSSVVHAISGNEHFVAIACADHSLNMFHTKTGRRLHSPIVLGTNLARMSCIQNHLLIITCAAQLWLWDVDRFQMIIKKESLNPLLIHPTSGEHLSLVSATVSSTLPVRPVVTVSNGCSYVFDLNSSCWCMVANAFDPLSSCTDLRVSSSIHSLTSGFKPMPSRSLLTFFASNTNTAHCSLLNFIDLQIESSKLLGNVDDYRYWVTTLVQNLVSGHSSNSNVEIVEARLHELFDELIGQSQSISSSPQSTAKRKANVDLPAAPNWNFNKRDFLGELLAILAPSLSLRRLYREYKDQMESQSNPSGSSSGWLTNLTSSMHNDSGVKSTTTITKVASKEGQLTNGDCSQLAKAN